MQLLPVSLHEWSKITEQHQIKEVYTLLHSFSQHLKTIFSLINCNVEMLDNSETKFCSLYLQFPPLPWHPTTFWLQILPQQFSERADGR